MNTCTTCNHRDHSFDKIKSYDGTEAVRYHSWCGLKCKGWPKSCNLYDREYYGTTQRKIVTKGSNDGTFEVGDHIILYGNGDIWCIEAGGWIPSEKVPLVTVGMEYEEDAEYIKQKIDRLTMEFERLKG